MVFNIFDAYKLCLYALIWNTKHLIDIQSHLSYVK